MRKTKHVVILLFMLLVVASVLSVVPSHSRSIGVDETFRYGPPDSQMTTTGGTYIRQWRGFPATIYEVETVQRDGEGYYESAQYNIQPYNLWLLIANIIFWMALFIALLAPITIFYRPKARSNPSDKLPDVQPTIEANKDERLHENHRD